MKTLIVVACLLAIIGVISSGERMRYAYTGDDVKVDNHEQAMVGIPYKVRKIIYYQCFYWRSKNYKCMSYMNEGVEKKIVFNNPCMLEECQERAPPETHCKQPTAKLIECRNATDSATAAPVTTVEHDLTTATPAN